MNSYLLHFVGKLISLLVVSVASLFGSYTLNTVETVNTNTNLNKSLNRINTIVEYDTIIKKTSKLPFNNKRVIVEGEDGLVYENPTTKQTEIIKEVVNKVVEVGTGPSGDFRGRLTAYGADCKGCSGTVACKTKDRKSFNLYKDGIIYKDDEYGDIRILAAAHEVFPCGTIIEVYREADKPFIGVVMDTGYAMRTAWKEQSKIVIDLAFLSQKDPGRHKTTSNNVDYNVLRWGW